MSARPYVLSSDKVRARNRNLSPARRISPHLHSIRCNTCCLPVVGIHMSGVHTCYYPGQPCHYSLFFQVVLPLSILELSNFNVKHKTLIRTMDSDAQ